ncbi:hypothetical protein [Streptomyces cadmiisoli]
MRSPPGEEPAPDQEPGSDEESAPGEGPASVEADPRGVPGGAYASRR